jgi:SAM-dependent methyltransferase
MVDDCDDTTPCSSRISMRFMTDAPTLLTGMEDIKQFDSEFWECTKGLYVRTGSILRVPSSAYPKWGIRVTSENKAKLAAQAEWFRRKDYAEREDIPEVDKIEKSKHSASTRGTMAVTIGAMTKEALREASGPVLRVCNIAANTGEAAVALASAIHMDPTTREILERTFFHLVDYSAKKLEIAKRNLERYVPAQRIELHPQGDCQFFDDNTRTFNAVFCLGHFHKKPFLDVLAQIHRSLVDGGVLVSGDWHSSICDQPHTMYQTLRMMGVDKRRLGMFENLMGNLMKPREDWLSDEEREAVRQHQQMWIDLVAQSGSRIAEIKGQPRFYIGGAFRTTKRTMWEIERRGFVVSTDEIRRIFPRMQMHSPRRMVRGADSATVMMGVKRAR